MAKRFSVTHKEWIANQANAHEHFERKKDTSGGTAGMRQDILRFKIDAYRKSLFDDTKTQFCNGL